MGMIIKGKERYKGYRGIENIRGNTPLSHTLSKPLNLINSINSINSINPINSINSINLINSINSIINI